MKLAVLSDTHGLLRPEVKKIISECDAVLHAGDIASQKIIDEIEKAKRADAPLYIVRGNNDKEWAEHLPHHLTFSLGGANLFLVHNKKDVPEELGDRQIVIYGHSHKYAEEWKDGRLWLNPGSCGRRRFRMELTMAVLELDEDGWRAERVDIPDETPQKREKDAPQKCGRRNIEAVLKRMEKGQTVSRIAEELKLEPAFVEEICRIKVTHPGVTALGILDKMEVNKTGR
ncbi:MAG TPA: metallophosphatase family protein [Candidatus Blautia excrementipullorum]|nr:metallophosphatase family protein [Candidatus Blautia excrementipullorum]